MKKPLIITGSLLLFLVLLLLLFPVFLRNDITGIIERQAARHLDARLHIEAIHLNMFRNFPALNVSIRNITLSGKKDTDGDTLLHVPLLSASVNVFSLLKGKEVIVNRLLLKDALFTHKITAPSYLNRDSVPASPADKSAASSRKKNAEEIKLSDIRIENLAVDYRNEISRTHTRIERVDMSANLRERIFDIRQGTLSVNDLPLVLSGWIGLAEETSDLELQLKTRILSSDFTLGGRLSDCLPSLREKRPLKGDFSLTSQSVNLNELMKAIEKTAASPDSLSHPDRPAVIPELPANPDLLLRTDIQELLLDRLTIRNIKGDIRLADASISSPGLDMELLDGSLRMSGDYGTVRPGTPRFNLKTTISDADIHSACESFSFIRQNLPIALDCKGRISADCQLSADLTSTGALNLKTADGKGCITSQNIVIDQNPTMQALASLLKNEELNRIAIGALKIEFEMQKGNLTVKPFTTTLAGNPVTVRGRQSAEGNIAYDLSLSVNRKYFGKDIESILKSIPGSNNIENLDLDVSITGTLNRPEVKTDLSKALKTIRKEAGKELKKIYRYFPF